MTAAARLRPAVIGLPLAALLFAAATPAAGGEHPPAPAAQGCTAGACHGDLARRLAAAPSAHEPAREGQCTACHDLALAGVAWFVRGFRPGPPAEAEPGAHAGFAEPCKDCHDPRLAAPQSAAATGFREGGKNLHFLHVAAGGTGRRCLGCHAPHAAPQPRLLRAEMRGRRGERIPQRFLARPRGGRCETGCHAPKDYARE